MKYLLALLAALVLVVNGQPPPPQRCMKTPTMWSGFFYENDFTAQGNEPYVRFAAVDYDASVEGKEKIRIIEFDELSRPGRINSVRKEEWYIFEEKTEYVLDLRTMHCEKMELENGFRPFGVINDAEFRGTTWLGVESVPKLGLEVDHFYYSRTDDSLNHHYSSYWVPVPGAEDTCVPVEQHFINLSGPRNHGPSFDSRFTFLNITTVTNFPDDTFNHDKCRL